MWYLPGITGTIPSSCTTPRQLTKDIFLSFRSQQYFKEVKKKTMSLNGDQLVVRDLVSEVVDHKIAENSRKSVDQNCRQTLGENGRQTLGENGRHIGSRIMVSPSIRKKSDSISSHDDDSFEEEECENGNQQIGKHGFLRKQQQVREKEQVRFSTCFFCWLAT